jgi:hypothetical protein
MPRWRVDYIGKKGSHLGTVEAPDEKTAIAKAAEEFKITPARRNKIAVTKLSEKSESPGLSLRRRPGPLALPGGRPRRSELTPRGRK